MAFVQNNGFMQAAYRQRQKGMHLNAPKAHAGSLAWEMNVALLQFEEATIEPLSRVGHVPLDGKNASEILLISK